MTNYYFTDNGMWLVFTASNEDGTADGVFAVSTSSAQATPILTGEGVYRSVTIADDGDQVAFLTNRDDWEADEPALTLYHAALGGGEARAVATEGTPGIPEGWWVPDNASSVLLRRRYRLFFSTAPRPPAEDEEEEEIPEDEQVVVDIWNWQDPVIQPMQLVQANQERNRNFLAYASTDDFRVVQLATENHPDVSVGQGGDGDLAIATTNTSVKYGELSPHVGSFQDVYLLDMATGEAELIFEKTAGPLPSQPQGSTSRGGTTSSGTTWSWTSARGRSETSPRLFPTRSIARTDDRPPNSGGSGIAGWLEDDEAILIYDKYDIWEVDPTGSPGPWNVTEGLGRANDIRLRYVNRRRWGGGGFRRHRSQRRPATFSLRISHQEVRVLPGPDRREPRTGTAAP